MDSRDTRIICDFPLGEAVDAGIVKVPLLGESDELVLYGDRKTPAHERYATHLKLGYQRYEKSYEKLSKVRKPILFVMTEDARAANEIADYLDSNTFPLLKGHILNIHTRLKGRIRNVIRGGREIKEFVESETSMKPDDLRELREMSRELDKKDSKFRCVVSVMMLREGWDVRNVTTIVPLRPYPTKSGILPEQTLGRGLRRMFPLGDTPEMGWYIIRLFAISTKTNLRRKVWISLYCPSVRLSSKQLLYSWIILVNLRGMALTKIMFVFQSDGRNGINKIM